MKERILIEDALKHCHEAEYYGRTPSEESLAGGIGVSREVASELIAALLEREFAQSDETGIRLSESGRLYARRVIRAHRLLETSMARETGLHDAEWHDVAEEKEHLLTDEETDRLSRRLGHPRWDPHGDPIPTPEGGIPALRGRELSGCEEDWQGRIAHIEDEPRGVYERVTRAGLVAGMQIRVLAPGKTGVRIDADGRVVELDRAAAGLIRVMELLPGEVFDATRRRLSDLKPGVTGQVVGLGPGCRGAERNRLLDLGFVPGSSVSIDLVSPSGNPVAYVVRGAAIALRREQAENVYIHLSEAKQ
jgi:DtxR family Mn-dependent transcriptional regulator